MNRITEALSDRQMAALRVRADFKGPATGPMRQGVRDASEWLGRQLRDYAEFGDRPTLRRALWKYATDTIKWDATDYEDGWAAVLDDVLAILDGDNDTINDLLRPIATP